MSATYYFVFPSCRLSVTTKAIVTIFGVPNNLHVKKDKYFNKIVKNSKNHKHNRF